MQRIIVVLAVGWAAGAWAQAGHQMTTSQVVVNSRTHWQNWSFPSGVLELGVDGSVRPQSLRRDINAVQDIVAHLQRRTPERIKKAPEDIVPLDAVQGGTTANIADVPNLFDGDMTTYWEPLTANKDADLASQWWFVVDLGRLVVAKKIVLKFVDKGMGDPFLQFDVLASQGNKPKGNQRSPLPEFSTLLRTLRPNKDQRIFTIDMDLEGDDFVGTGIRFVQVVVTGSDLDRGRELSLLEYKALPVTEQGAIDYFKSLSGRRETLVEQSVYERLDDERRGSIRYYHKERPRLAELEILSEGDEILSGMLERGGFGTATQTASISNMIDGEIESKVQFITVFGKGSLTSPEGGIFFDLGAFYWIDAFRLAYGGAVFRAYHLDFSDGSLEADGSLKWSLAVDRGSGVSGPRNNVQFDGSSPGLGFGTYEGNDFRRIKARFFRLMWKQFEAGGGFGGGSGQPAEIQLYGRGFHPKVTLTSDLVRLGDSRNLLSIEWDADTPPGTSVVLQTRTGNELDEVLRYFKNDGVEVSEAEYNKLLSIFRGDTIGEEVAGAGWSDWSQPYEVASGSPITSPSPREFLEIRAVLLSDEPDVSATLRAIRLNFTNPVAQGLAGEVAPFQVETLGEEQRFSFYVRPDFARQDPGFDQLLLVAPADMKLHFEGLYGGDEAALAVATAGMEIAGVEVVPTAGDSLRLVFPTVGPDSDLAALRLDFTTALFSTGAVLQASLQNSVSAAGGWQRVDPGEVVSAVVSNTTTLVGTVKRGALLKEVVVEPAVFSPNDDGINDEASFRFKVVKVSDDSPVEVLIHDLRGRLVRRLVEQRGLSTGTYGIAWDGKDADGLTVLPGVYLARLRVDTDIEGARIGNAEIFRTIAVAY
ncbi:MAG TPA: hypothetical protein EYQ18_04675 [Candidatus Handelsmanbacteria bacterium]|nr:hypothetical protein [Candidatus Handelsmanbacteria bacterium]